jgi:DNA-binding CsgD family transcriptional regulator
MIGALLSALCVAFDQFEAGFVLASAGGEILFANSAAQDMMDRGWPIRARDGVLQGHGREATEALLEALRRAAEFDGASVGGGCLDVRLASPQGAAIAVMKPLPKIKADGAGCCVAVCVNAIGSLDGRAAPPSLSCCYRLTGMETRVLQYVLAGGSVAEAAAAFNVTQNTVKSHLQSIFGKMKSTRQPRLIQLVNDLRPPLRPIAPAVAPPTLANGALPDAGSPLQGRPA